MPDPIAVAETHEPKLLGPFLGHVTTNSIKVWLHWENEHTRAYVTLHARDIDAPGLASATLEFKPEQLFTDCVTIEGLEPDTKYFYKLWTNPAHSLKLPLDGLTDKDLHFRTLSDDPNQQVDFLVMSCHNPTVAHEDGFEGHAVWADLPQIIAGESNKRVRFALMVGDQVYADNWQAQLLKEGDAGVRLRLYLSAYRRFWGNIHYRRVMCRMPAVMAWDDHDITDGWGSEESSFVAGTADFKPEWKRLFDAASSAFSIMQASRNPAPLSAQPGDGFDFGFKVGRWGFLFLDLRTNRNVKLHRLMTDEQAFRIRRWVEDNQRDLDTLFVISPVVFSHGSPVIDDFAVKLWPLVMKGVDWFAGMTKWGKGLQTTFNQSLADIRDDIRDSWGSKENAGQADMMLDFLFGLQNHSERPVGVVILSGDIHTSGYANIYSSDPVHSRSPSVAHITSSSVGYKPFNWLLEAIYRHANKTVALGTKGKYSSMISHHFCSRSVAVLSLRPMAAAGDFQLKVKYYLEGFPEPQTLVFDLAKASHRENVTWVAQHKLFDKDYAPSAEVDVEGLLKEKARTTTEKLNWDESIVDLLKLLGMDSSLGARKKLAQQWGYPGPLDGSAAMNIWLQQEVARRMAPDGQLDSGNPPTIL